MSCRVLNNNRQCAVAHPHRALQARRPIPLQHKGFTSQGNVSSPIVARFIATNAFAVRPYTVRRGDTLSTISEKRGFEMSEIIKLNHDIDPNTLREGQTIVVPCGKLSGRDREILDGMSRGRYRTYPLRKGESVEEVCSKRGISMELFKELNPDIDPKRVSANTVLKLPANKFTVREREMLIGAGAPQEFFASDDLPIFGAGLAFGAVIYGAVTYAIRKQKGDGDK